MTKKDFEVIAAIIARIETKHIREVVAAKFVVDFNDRFMRFKPEMFYRACDVLPTKGER